MHPAVIPENYLREWKEHAPWKTDSMVEQDLIICRSLVMLFANPVLAQHLAFRGGTALHKLHLAPASRYSEDIDLVQIVAIASLNLRLRSGIPPGCGRVASLAAILQILSILLILSKMLAGTPGSARTP